ncbi:MAG: hypothetical protein Q9167_004008 [Letrouitia subvulpina]
MTVGCTSWTTQPTANNCPTVAPVVRTPSNSAGSNDALNSTLGGNAAASASQASTLSSGEAVLTGTAGGQTVAETSVPTASSQLTSVTDSITTTIADLQGSSQAGALSVAPSAQSSVLSIPPNSSQAGASNHAEQTTITGTVGSQTITETFVLITISVLASLSSAITTTTTNAQSSLETLVVGPGGVAWTPLNQLPSNVPQLSPPALPLPSVIQPSSPPTFTSAASTGQQSASISSTAAQSSVSGAFDNPNQSETTIIIGGTTLHYSKETIQSLSTITAPTTITTPMVETNKDGTKFTVSAAIIIIGPGGTWWNGGTGGLGIHGPSCIWPFCPPAGGGDIDGGGSGKDPNDPNTPGSTEEPSDPDDNDDNQSKSDDNSSITQITSTPSSASTITGGSTSSGSSSSSSASSTASGQPCSPDCTVCNTDPTKLRLKMPRRGLIKHAPNQPVNGLSKRTLRTPADYGGNVMNFLLSEYAWAEWLNIHGTNGGPSTGFARALGNKRYDAAVHGLYGCTSVVVVSQAGMWISHFWEIPSFRATVANWGQPRTAPDIANFNDHVINQMQNGGNDIQGLRQFTAAGGEFAAAQRPVWAIITPQGLTPNSWRYEPEVNEIKGVLNDLFPASPPVIIDYVPKPDDNSQQNTASGKILFQYDPFQALIADPNNPCNVYQQAIFRLWVEDRPNYAWQKYWAAEMNQLITDFSTYNPNRKRENSPACQIPSKLPQASTVIKGEDMKYSAAPDPDETNWITLGASTEASKTPNQGSSSTKYPSPTSSTPATSLRCMADGAPWYSPTSAMITPVSTSAAPTNIPGQGGVPGCAAVDYPDGQAFPFLTTTISGKSTTNCDYTILPTASSCPPPTTTPPPPSITSSPAPSGTISCGDGSPDIATDSVSALISEFCGGRANYDPGAPTIAAAQPTADLDDIPDLLKDDQVLNNIYVNLVTGRRGCATATFALSASSSLCRGYFASITASCTQGGGLLTSAGCFDWGVKAYTAGQGGGAWPTKKS